MSATGSTNDCRSASHIVRTASLVARASSIAAKTCWWRSSVPNSPRSMVSMRVAGVPSVAARRPAAAKASSYISSISAATAIALLAK